MPRYNPATIEPKWQQYWRDKRTFVAPRAPLGPKLYVLDMFPYPSGDGLHVGHPEGYTATDITCRYQRMRGRSVLHPMGWDAFGLPAEQHAIRTGTPPRITTEKNIATFRRQLQMLGFSYDWDREFSTTDPDYFRWTQWIFLKLFNSWFDAERQQARPIDELPIPADVQRAGADAERIYRDEHRLAYQSDALVNWCPDLGTVLSNEEVKDGRSERGGHPVFRRELRQWMLRITAYAERLEKDLEPLDWSEGIKALQRNWIGRSAGAEVDFFVGSTRGTQDKAAQTSAFDSWKAARTKTGFPRKPADDVLRIFTTRPDTLFGATYMVIAPEHPLVDDLQTPERQEVLSYREQASRKSDLDRTDLSKTKTGRFTGLYAINPVNGDRIPIWVADYVLMGYGTGAIMAVPAHDARDFAFAKEFGLTIKVVVVPTEKDAWWLERAGDTGVPLPYAQLVQRYIDSPEDQVEAFTRFDVDTVVVNSTDADLSLDRLSAPAACDKVTRWLLSNAVGASKVSYKLRDWLFSRQHFWGEPFPILHELLPNVDYPSDTVRALSEEDLPLNLPEMKHFKPHGRPEPPLEEAPSEWLYPVIDGVRYKRETNTMPQWAGSCWYYLRFIDPKNDRALVDPALEKAWMPVDLYVGGAEHAVLHLLYSRFWHKFLFDIGVVSTPEPFAKLVNQGMILGEVEYKGWKNQDGDWVAAPEDQSPGFIPDEAWFIDDVPASDVEKVGNHFVLKANHEIRLESQTPKMSKSRGNVVNPDEIVEEYGADSLRLYEMFMGPLEAVKPWSTRDVNGVRGFLDRVWRMITAERSETLELNPALVDDPPTTQQNRVLHRTIQGVTLDIERMFFNTAISKMMEFTNFFLKEERRPRAVMETLVLLLSPFAPHMAEELWQLLGHPKSLAYEPWPTFDEAAIKEDTIEVPVQVNGKLRGRVVVATDADAAATEAAARADARIAELLAGKTVVKVIAVPGRLVNFVVK